MQITESFICNIKNICWVNEELQTEITKFLAYNTEKTVSIQFLAKAALEGKFTALNAYQWGKKKTNELSMQFKVRK